MAHMDISDLDYSQPVYQRLDPTEMRDRLGGLPRQCREGWTRAMNAVLPGLHRPIQHVVIGGMGGSAIAGDLVADLAAAQATIPISVVRDSYFPFALNQNTLFIACSHSGRTRETLSLFRQALQQDAQVMAVTGGGTLAEESRSRGVPLLTIDAPGEPRSAAAHSLMLLLGALRRVGVLDTRDEDVARALETLGREISGFNEQFPGDGKQGNPAKNLAWDLRSHLVIVYGGGLFAGMARRWKCQLNENAKVWAFAETVPELLHNAVEAYGSSRSLSRDVFVLLLEAADDREDLKIRNRVTCNLLEQLNVSHEVLKAIDGPPLAQLLTMLSLGDYVSYYLALLQGLDPSTNHVIDLGKDILDELASDA